MVKTAALFKPSHRPCKVSYEVGFAHLLIINPRVLLLAGALLEGYVSVSYTIPAKKRDSLS